MGASSVVANKSRNKNWSFVPQTLGLKNGMDHARNYLKEDVVERLTGKMRADQAHALLSSTSNNNNENIDDLLTSRPFNPSASAKSTVNTDQFFNSGSSNLKQSSDKSFHEFLARQNELKLRKETKTKLLASETTPVLKSFMDENSRQIHDASNRGSFLERVDRDEQRREVERKKEEMKKEELSSEVRPYNFY